MKTWQAAWIADRDFAALAPVPTLHKEYAAPEPFEHPESLRNRHMYARKTFALEEKPSRATLRISADDYYKLYVNGRFVGQGPAQGYPFRYFYNEWDVAPFLTAGDNVIAVHAYYQGHIHRYYNSGDLRQGLIAELHTEHGLVAATDGTWRTTTPRHYGTSGTVGYDTQYLEDIDERLAIKGWRDVGFADDGWAYATVKAETDYAFVAQPTPAVSVYRVRPERVEEIAPGHYVLDFGRELTGHLEMRARGRAGDRIELRFGEELLSDGRSVRYEMRCNCTYAETWTLSGGDDALEPFEYKAFRYAEVSGPAGVVRPDSFEAVVRHYPIDDDASRFETDHERLRRIWDMCRLGVLLCSQESYVDCPSREKGQYLGDNTVTGHSHLYLTGDPRLFRKAIEDFASTAAVCPGLLAVAPGNFMQEIADFSLQWPMQLMTYYRYTGDEAFLREMYPVSEGILKYFRGYAREDGLLANVKEKWNLVDWPENLRDGYDFPLTRPVSDGCHNVVNALYYGCVQTVQAIRDALGVSYEDELPKLRASFLAAFYRPEAKRFADSTDSSHMSLHANLFPLLFRLSPAEATPSIVSLIREKRMSCGVYMSYFLLKALAEHGETALVYELLTCDDERSWANMLREDATSCFEAWGKDQKWNTSLCHAWASAPIPLLIEDVIGLQPAEPGWSAVRFKPRVPAEMGDIRLEFRTPRGPIRFERVDGDVRLQVPEGVEVRHL